MNKNTIVEIIQKQGYNLEIIDNPKVLSEIQQIERITGIYELNFGYNPTKDTSMKEVLPNLKTRMQFKCSSKDFKKIDIVAFIGFRNKDLIDIISPEEGIRAFEWLRNVNEYLKKLGYEGTFHNAGYSDNDAHNFRYTETTCYNEEFIRLISNFKEAYTREYHNQSILKNNNHK